MAGVSEQRAERHQDVGVSAQRDRRRGSLRGVPRNGEIRSIGTCHVWSDYRDRAIRFSVRVLRVLPAGLSAHTRDTPDGKVIRNNVLCQKVTRVTHVTAEAASVFVHSRCHPGKRSVTSG